MSQAAAAAAAAAELTSTTAPECGGSGTPRHNNAGSSQMSPNMLSNLAFCGTQPASLFSASYAAPFYNPFSGGYGGSASGYIAPPTSGAPAAGATNAAGFGSAGLGGSGGFGGYGASVYNYGAGGLGGNSYGTSSYGANPYGALAASSSSYSDPQPPAASGAPDSLTEGGANTADAAATGAGGVGGTAFYPSPSELSSSTSSSGLLPAGNPVSSSSSAAAVAAASAYSDFLRTSNPYMSTMMSMMSSLSGPATGGGGGFAGPSFGGAGASFSSGGSGAVIASAAGGAGGANGGCATGSAGGAAAAGSTVPSSSSEESSTGSGFDPSFGSGHFVDGDGGGPRGTTTASSGGSSGGNAASRRRPGPGPGPESGAAPGGPGDGAAGGVNPAAGSTNSPPVKRPRGRPRKHPLPIHQSMAVPLSAAYSGSGGGPPGGLPAPNYGAALLMNSLAAAAAAAGMPGESGLVDPASAAGTPGGFARLGLLPSCCTSGACGTFGFSRPFGPRPPPSPAAAPTSAAAAAAAATGATTPPPPPDPAMNACASRCYRTLAEQLRQIDEMPAEKIVTEEFCAYGGPFGLWATALRVNGADALVAECEKAAMAETAVPAAAGVAKQRREGSPVKKEGGLQGDSSHLEEATFKETRLSGKVEAADGKNGTTEEGGVTRGERGEEMQMNAAPDPRADTSWTLHLLRGSEQPSSARTGKDGVEFSRAGLLRGLNLRVPIRDFAVSRHHMAALLGDGAVFLFRQKTAPLVRTGVGQWEEASALRGISVAAIRLASANLAPGWRDRFHRQRREVLIQKLRAEIGGSLRKPVAGEKTLSSEKSAANTRCTLLSDDELQQLIDLSPHNGILCCNPCDLDPDWLPDPVCLAAIDVRGTVRFCKTSGYYNYPQFERRAALSPERSAPVPAADDHESVTTAASSQETVLVHPVKNQMNTVTGQYDESGLSADGHKSQSTTTHQEGALRLRAPYVVEKNVYLHPTRSRVRLELVEKMIDMNVVSSRGPDGRTVKVSSRVVDVAMSEMVEESILAAAAASETAAGTSVDIAAALQVVSGEAGSAAGPPAASVRPPEGGSPKPPLPPLSSVFVKGKGVYIRFKNFPTAPTKLHCGPLGHSGALLLSNGTVWAWGKRAAGAGGGPAARETVGISQLGGSLRGRRVVDLAGVGSEFIAVTADGAVHRWNARSSYGSQLADSFARACSIPRPEPEIWAPAGERGVAIGAGGEPGDFLNPASNEKDAVGKERELSGESDSPEKETILFKTEEGSRGEGRLQGELEGLESTPIVSARPPGAAVKNLDRRKHEAGPDASHAGAAAGGKGSPPPGEPRGCCLSEGSTTDSGGAGEPGPGPGPEHLAEPGPEPPAEWRLRAGSSRAATAGGADAAESAAPPAPDRVIRAFLTEGSTIFELANGGFKLFPNELADQYFAKDSAWRGQGEGVGGCCAYLKPEVAEQALRDAASAPKAISPPPRILVTPNAVLLARRETVDVRAALRQQLTARRPAALVADDPAALYEVCAELAVARARAERNAGASGAGCGKKIAAADAARGDAAAGDAAAGDTVAGDAPVGTASAGGAAAGAAFGSSRRGRRFSKPPAASGAAASAAVALLSPASRPSDPDAADAASDDSEFEVSRHARRRLGGVARRGGPRRRGGGRGGSRGGGSRGFGGSGRGFGRGGFGRGSFGRGGSAGAGARACAPEDSSAVTIPRVSRAAVDRSGSGPDGVSSNAAYSLRRRQAAAAAGTGPDSGFRSAPLPPPPLLVPAGAGARCVAAG